MKRDIKFRGRCIKSNDWVFGDLIHGVGSKNGNVYILPNEVNLAYVKHCDPLDGVRVNTEMVGQLTGIKDRKGNDIYVGDIVKDAAMKYVVKFGEYYQDEHRYVGFYMESPTDSEYIGGFSSSDSNVIEIIGNIHENKTLS